MKEKSKKDQARLLSLLGVEEGFVPPSSFRAAKQLHEEEEGASKPIRKDNDCGKVCFATKKDALSRMGWMEKKGRASVHKLRAYHCPECDAYHFTKSL